MPSEPTAVPTADPTAGPSLGSGAAPTSDLTSDAAVVADAAGVLPGLTACSLCAGETLAGGGPLEAVREEQLDRWRRLAADGVARVTFVECLDECERGDVVVARPSAPCRSAGAAPVWFEQVAGDGLTAEVAGWLRSGGPGAAPVPEPLRQHRIERSAP